MTAINTEVGDTSFDIKGWEATTRASVSVDNGPRISAVNWPFGPYDWEDFFYSTHTRELTYVSDYEDNTRFLQRILLYSIIQPERHRRQNFICEFSQRPNFPIWCCSEAIDGSVRS
ncbi:hypothetical protein PM082_009063 [Marasmius tenuissimus]|nr:hypothetical protein PM082_009063 [Marasmius tenuissimus]